VEVHEMVPEKIVASIQELELLAKT
jgi:hypothetical protein